MHHNLDTELWNSFTQHSKAPVNPLTPTGTDIHLVLKEAAQWVLRGCLSYIRNMFGNTLWAVFSSLASLTLWRSEVNITDNLTHAVVCRDPVWGLWSTLTDIEEEYGIKYLTVVALRASLSQSGPWEAAASCSGCWQGSLLVARLSAETFHCRRHRWILAHAFLSLKVSALRVSLAAEVMWNVREGGNTFFNTLMFGKHLSHLVSAINWPAGRGWMSFTQHSR